MMQVALCKSGSKYHVELPKSDSNILIQMPIDKQGLEIVREQFETEFSEALEISDESFVVKRFFDIVMWVKKNFKSVGIRPLTIRSAEQLLSISGVTEILRSPFRKIYVQIRGESMTFPNAEVLFDTLTQKLTWTGLTKVDFIAELQGIGIPCPIHVKPDVKSRNESVPEATTIDRKHTPEVDAAVRGMLEILQVTISKYPSDGKIHVFLISGEKVVFDNAGDAFDSLTKILPGVFGADLRAKFVKQFE